MVVVNDLMTPIPSSVKRDTNLRHIIGVMKSEGCRQLPVLENGKLVGIITDRDVRLVMNSPMVLHGRWQDEELLDRLTAESIMTPNPITVTPDTPAARAAEMLSVYKFGSLPVVENDTLVGIISVSDFLDYIVETLSRDEVRG